MFGRKENIFLENVFSEKQIGFLLMFLCLVVSKKLLAQENSYGDDKGGIVRRRGWGRWVGEKDTINIDCHLRNLFSLLPLMKSFSSIFKELVSFRKYFPKILSNQTCENKKTFSSSIPNTGQVLFFC